MKPPKYRDGLTAFEYMRFEYMRLVEWMKDLKRKPANTAFTAGTLRDCARAFEAAMANMSKP